MMRSRVVHLPTDCNFFSFYGSWHSTPCLELRVLCRRPDSLHSASRDTTHAARASSVVTDGRRRRDLGTSSRPRFLILSRFLLRGHTPLVIGLDALGGPILWRRRPSALAARGRGRESLVSHHNSHPRVSEEQEALEQPYGGSR